MSRANPEPDRRPKNEAEAICFDILKSNGWTITKRGWPDFFIRKGNVFAAVEVKRRNTHRLKYHQRTVMMALAHAGIPVYRYDPDEGFQRAFLPHPQTTKNDAILPPI